MSAHGPLSLPDRYSDPYVRWLADDTKVLGICQLGLPSLARARYSNCLSNRDILLLAPNGNHLPPSLIIIIISMSSSTDLPRNDFYQSEDRFTVSFYVKGLKAEDVSVSFRETSVRSSHALMTRDRVAGRVKLN
jgi:hypothetical protein